LPDIDTAGAKIPRFAAGTDDEKRSSVLLAEME
jgi:hypothetical protein